MTVNSPVADRLNARGFTLIELMVGMMLGLIVMGVVYTTLIGQWRSNTLQQETMDARETLRGAAALLSGEFRWLSANDLRNIAPESLTVRSIEAVGIVCIMHATADRYGIFQPSGTFAAAAGDSVLLYSSSGSNYRPLGVSSVSTSPASVGVGTCDWTGKSPSVAVDVTPVAAGDTAGVGSVLRGFRSIRYGTYSWGGRWWLGRDDGAGYEVLTGPIAAPADSGLVFHYYDAAGAETAVAANVARVEIVLKAESFGRARSLPGTAAGYRKDSVTTVAFLRN